MFARKMVRVSKNVETEDFTCERFYKKVNIEGKYSQISGDMMREWANNCWEANLGFVHSV